ncbi:hypothetical protein D3C87_397840 [compost metagenome]
MLQIKSLLKTYRKQIAISVFLVGLVCVYYLIDPSKSSFFLTCPLKSVSGYDCPGCGVQRAFHELLHFRFLEAFKYNPLFVLSIPILVIVLLMKSFGSERTKTVVNNFFKSKFLIFSLLIIVLVLLLLRNTDLYKDFIHNL